MSFVRNESFTQIVGKDVARIVVRLEQQQTENVPLDQSEIINLASKF